MNITTWRNEANRLARKSYRDFLVNGEIVAPIKSRSKFRQVKKIQKLFDKDGNLVGRAIIRK